MPGSMKISIITACYNSEETIGDTLRSIAAQSYRDIEHIIVDGGSRDKTMQIVECDGTRVAQAVSEPDKGIYDAMNKGIAMATGDVVGILNSDDIYADSDVILRVAEAFSDPAIDCVFGDLVYVERENIDRVVRTWKSSPFVAGAFRAGWHPPHPTFFVRRSVYDECGKFNVGNSVSADFEIMLRFLERYHRKSIYIPRVLVKMRYGGESNASIKNIMRGNLNILRAFQQNNLPVNPVAYPVRRLFPKLLNLLRHRFQ